MTRMPILALAIGLLGPSAALAGGTAVVELQGGAPGTGAGHGKSTISWRDPGTVRMEAPGTGGYVLERDGSLYSVARIGGKMRVIDMASMMKMARATTRSADTQMPGTGAIRDVTDTGKTRTEAGIEGRLYRITIEDPDGTTRESKVVLTRDARVRDLTRAYLGMMSAMTQGGSPNAGLEGWMSKMPHPYDGILAIGDSYRLISISDATPPAKTFTLPAKPLDIGGLMKGMGN